MLCQPNEVMLVLYCFLLKIILGFFFWGGGSHKVIDVNIKKWVPSTLSKN
jgi:hypothetical protein